MANIRTIDYQGFLAASGSYGPSGWCFWSGSISELTSSGGADTIYTGVGIEVIASSESYIRYSASQGPSNDSGLDIRTNKFFLGSPSTAFISGSGDGTFAISSSNFELNEAGAITATSGQMGGWTIASTKLTGGSMEISASGKLSTDTDVNTTRIIVDGSTTPSTLQFYSGSSKRFEFTTNILHNAEPDRFSGSFDPDIVCHAASPSGISGMQLNNRKSGIIAYLGGGATEALKIIPGRILVQGANSASGTHTLEQFKVRRDITGCLAISADVAEDTTAARFEYQSDIEDNGSYQRSSVWANTRIQHTESNAIPIGVYASASTNNTDITAYSFYGDDGVLYNNGQLQIESDMSTSASNYLVDFNSGDIEDAFILKLTSGDNSSTAGRFISFNNSVGEYGFIKPNGGTAVSYITSDIRLKKNIKDTELNLEDLLKLQVRDFKWKNGNIPDTGFIAQEVYKVLPLSVDSQDPNRWYLNQESFIPLMVKSIQEQNQQIQDLTDRLKKLEDIINGN